MSRTKHPAVIAVEQCVTDVLSILGSTEPVTSRTLERTNTPKPYREVRIWNETIFEAYHSPALRQSIGTHIKESIPNVIGVYPKQYIPDNRVRHTNNTDKSGLMIHVKL
jgi:actin-like ATPase involved in cell morphogenesis